MYRVFVLSVLCLSLVPLLDATSSNESVGYRRVVNAAGTSLEHDLRLDVSLPRKLARRLSQWRPRRRPVPRIKRFWTVIKIAADEEAWVYHNGKQLAHVNDWRNTKIVKFKMAQHDVIAVKATSKRGSGGVILDIRCTCDRLDTVTSWRRRTAWKTIHALGNRSNWISKKYSSCSWKHPVRPHYRARPRKSKSFPYSSGAQYVWAPRSRSGMKHTIWLRYVHGGETCFKPKKPKRPIYRPAPRKILVPTPSSSPKSAGKGHINGRSDGGQKYCKCKPIANVKSYCYDMKSANILGRCKKRKCENKYECVASGGSDLDDCIRRIAVHEIVPYPRYAGHCLRRSVTPRYFWVRY